MKHDSESVVNCPPSSMLRGVLLLFFILICLLETYSQARWSEPERIYSDNNITVEISFKINPCEAEESVNSSKFKYRVAGTFRSYEYYLNWKMDYIDCNGNLFYETNYLNIGEGSPAEMGTTDAHQYVPQDNEFTCKSLETHFYEVSTSYSKSTGSGVRSVPLSKDPESITGELKTYIGDQTTLTVKGGVLGIGAKWVWYSGTCGGKKVGEGSSLVVAPMETTTYFVRAESDKNITNCSNATVSVNQNSKAPEAIEGDQTICKGEATRLFVTGGKLGLNANWVWTKNDCGGEEIGRGSSITVSPDKPTSYFVKAVGNTNTTACIQATVYPYERSSKPIQITSSKVTCANEPITLTVEGGKLASDANWKWYSGYCMAGSPIGVGKTLQVTPMTSKFYFVKAEGECNTTDCASIHVSPDRISTAPSYISSSNLKSGKILLTLNGGELGKDAVWKWYKNDCYKGISIGKGTEIKVRARKPTYYFVKAEGACNTTNCATQFVTPTAEHKFSPTYTDTKNGTPNNKFLHLGIGLGLDIANFASHATRIQRNTASGGSTTTSLMDVNITGFGAKGEFVFHPYMKDFFSIGIVTAGAVGTTPYVFAGGKRTILGLSNKEKYFYTRFDLGLEIAAGHPRIKGLLVYKSSIQTHQYSASGTSFGDKIDYTFKADVRREVVSAGIRVAPYSNAKPRFKRGFSFDFVYSFAHDYTWQWQNFDWKYTPISKWQSGVGMALWIQSILKMQVDVFLNSKLASTSTTTSSNIIQFSLIYNRNAFY